MMAHFLEPPWQYNDASLLLDLESQKMAFELKTVFDNASLEDFYLV